MPKSIGEKFPYLKELNAERCGLTIISESFFERMRRLQNIYLSDNEITTIASKAFKDLVSVKELWLRKNMLRTVDANIFATMEDLERIELGENKLIFLSPSTFTIPRNGKLRRVQLGSNVCINKLYTSDLLNQLESDITAACGRRN